MAGITVTTITELVNTLQNQDYWDNDARFDTESL